MKTRGLFQALVILLWLCLAIHGAKGQGIPCTICDDPEDLVLTPPLPGPPHSTFIELNGCPLLVQWRLVECQAGEELPCQSIYLEYIGKVNACCDLSAIGADVFTVVNVVTDAILLKFSRGFLLPDVADGCATVYRRKCWRLVNTNEAIPCPGECCWVTRAVGIPSITYETVPVPDDVCDGPECQYVCRTPP